MDVLHPEKQQCQQHDDRFLLVPGDIVGDGQLVDIVEAEHFLQFQGDDRQRIGIVALTGVQHPGDPADIAQRQFVVPVFRAAGRQNHRVFRQFRRELGVILPGLHAAVAAGHDEEFFDRAGLHRFHHFVGHGKYLLMGEAADNLAGFDFCRRFQGFRQSDDRREILLAVGSGSDVRTARITGGAGGEDPSPHLFAPGRHDAVGRKQNGAVERFEFAHLFPPGVPIVADEVVVLFEIWIIVGRQHLAVRVHIDAGSPGLLQQLLKVGQIVAGDQDGRIAAHADVHFRNLRIAVFRSIGGVEQRHRLHAMFAGLQGQGDQLVGG